VCKTSQAVTINIDVKSVAALEQLLSADADTRLRISQQIVDRFVESNLNGLVKTELVAEVSRQLRELIQSSVTSEVERQVGAFGNLSPAFEERISNLVAELRLRAISGLRLHFNDDVAELRKRVSAEVNKVRDECLSRLSGEVQAAITEELKSKVAVAVGKMMEDVASSVLRNQLGV